MPPSRRSQTACSPPGNFVPTMVGLMAAPDSPESVASAVLWQNLNYLRHAILLAAWVAALKTFSLFYQHRSGTVGMPACDFIAPFQ